MFRNYRNIFKRAISIYEYTRSRTFSSGAKFNIEDEIFQVIFSANGYLEYVPNAIKYRINYKTIFCRSMRKLPNYWH